MNKYVVKLSPQEFRHAKGSGRFHEFVEALGRLSFWREDRIFTKHQIARMRATELAGELTILLLEGPQDKKASLDLYYVQYQYAASVRKRCDVATSGIPQMDQACPSRVSRFAVPQADRFIWTNWSSRRCQSVGKRLKKVDPQKSGLALSRFEGEMTKRRASRKAVATWQRPANKQITSGLVRTESESCRPPHYELDGTQGRRPPQQQILLSGAPSITRWTKRSPSPSRTT